MEIVNWMAKPENLTAAAYVLGALALLVQVVMANWMALKEGNFTARLAALEKLGKPLHDIVEKLGPVTAGTKADRYVQVMHSALDFLGCGKPAPEVIKAVGAAIHDAAKAADIAKGMAQDPQPAPPK